MEIIERFQLELVEYEGGSGRMDYYRVDDAGRWLVPERCRDLTADEVSFLKSIAPDDGGDDGRSD